MDYHSVKFTFASGFAFATVQFFGASAPAQAGGGGEVAAGGSPVKQYTRKRGRSKGKWDRNLTGNERDLETRWARAEGGWGTGGG